MGITRQDLNTVGKMVTTQATALGLGKVPATNRRWITFIRADNRYGGINTLYLCSTPASNTCQKTNISGRVAYASAYAKDRIQFSNEESKIIPPNGPVDVDRPLFSIAGSGFLSTMTTKGPVNLFIQYFDEARN